MAKISVGLPVFNGERYLEEALDSILTQSETDIEVVISDNASTDRTQEIVQDCLRRDSRVRVEIQATNRGAAFNYNRVFELSRSPYFRWAAADDIWHRDLLSECLEVLESRPDVALAYPKTELVDAYGDYLSFYEDNLCLMHDSPMMRACRFVRNINLCSAVFGLHRRSALERSSLIQSFAGSDAVLLFQTALSGKIFEVPRPLFQRRVHSGASHEASKSADDIQAWFDPSKSRSTRILGTRERLFVEYLKSVRSQRWSAMYRSCVAVAVTAVWSYRRLRAQAGLLKGRLLGQTSRSGEKRFANVK